MNLLKPVQQCSMLIAERYKCIIYSYKNIYISATMEQNA